MLSGDGVMCEVLLRAHCAGPSFFSKAGQLTMTVSGAPACPVVARTRKRWPSGATWYGLQPMSIAGSGNNSRGGAGSSESGPRFRLTAINLLSSDT